MEITFVRMAVIVAWVLAVGTLGLAVGVTSIAGWAGFAVIALVPPAVILRLWRAPVPSMSETIRDVLR